MNSEQLLRELEFKAVRSSGPGGQHVNKTSSKVSVQLHIANSIAFSDLEKERLLVKLKQRITTEGFIVLQCGETRSQHRNKAIVIQRLINLLSENLYVRKQRKRTKPSRLAIEKRLKNKKQLAMKKVNRKPPKIE